MSEPRRVELPNGRYAYEEKPGSALILYQQVLQYFESGIEPEAGMTVLDAGANIGLFALEVLQRTQGQARVFCFEPAPAIHSLMRRGLQEQFPGADLQMFSYGLSSAAGEATFYYRPHASAMSSLDSNYIFTNGDFEQITARIASADCPEEYRGPSWLAWVPTPLSRWLVRQYFHWSMRKVTPIRCRLTTISEVIREHELDRIDLLKIDVEGAEWDVLQGIEEADWPRIRTLALELHDIDGRLDAVKKLLVQQGFANVHVEQEEIFRTTSLYSLWATRDLVCTNPEGEAN